MCRLVVCKYFMKPAPGLYPTVYLSLIYLAMVAAAAAAATAATAAAAAAAAASAAEVATAAAATAAEAAAAAAAEVAAAAAVAAAAQISVNNYLCKSFRSLRNPRYRRRRNSPPGSCSLRSHRRCPLFLYIHLRLKHIRRFATQTYLWWSGETTRTRV